MIIFFVQCSLIFHSLLFLATFLPSIHNNTLLSQKGASMSVPVLFCTCVPRLRQEDLRDTAGLVADLCSEVNITKSKPDDYFGFPRPLTLDLRYSVVL